MGDVLRIAEQFGPTIQGEGPSAGRLAVFIRTSGCNLDCGWCDTPYTWDWERYDREQEQTRVYPRDLAGWVTSTAPSDSLVVFTGGEPLLQESGLFTVAAITRDTRPDLTFEIETNGTRAPGIDWLTIGTRFNVSPKLANSGVNQDRRIIPGTLATYAALARYNHTVCFKFVATAPDDLVEVDHLVAAFRIPACTVWIMPEGRNPDTLTTRTIQLAEAVITRGYNLTPRLHINIWGDQRGR